jgi:hypothetical protein
VKIGGAIVNGEVSGDTGVASVTVGLDFAGEIIAPAGSIGAVKIGGSVNQSEILSQNNIASVAIGGSVVSSSILAGISGTPGVVKIGAVTVGGDWIASNLSAGASQTGDGYGNADNVLVATSSQITSIAIAGIVSGTASTGDHFGFDAESIGSFKLGGAAVTLPAAPGSVALSPATGDVNIELIA